MEITRRELGKSALVLGAAASLGQWTAAPAQAAVSVSYSDWGQDRYLTYPHQNAYFANGGSILLGQIDSGTTSSLWAYNIAAGTSYRVGGRSFTNISGFVGIYPDVCDANDTVAFTAENALWVCGLGGSATPLKIFEPPAGNTIDPLCSIRYADGLYVLTSYRPTGSVPPNGDSTIVQVKKDGTFTRDLVTMGFFANHVHHVPFNEAYVGFSREGNGQPVPSRVWGWKDPEAINGKQVWDELGANGLKLGLTHERWMFDRLACVVIASGGSPGQPTGLYEVNWNGTDTLIRSASNYIHCNVSRDGEWFTVDAHAGSGEASVYVFNRSGSFPPLLLGTTKIMSHPKHPHPSFSPDGRTVVFNHTNTAGQIKVLANTYR